MTTTTNNWQSTLADIVKCGGRRVYLSGPPGTGKTTFAAHLLGDNSERVAMHSDLSAQELAGHWIAKGGEWTWHAGPLVRNVRACGNLMLDELPQAQGSALDFCRAVCDDCKAETTLNDGSRMRLSHPGIVIGAGNLPIDRLPTALADRFINLQVGAPSDDLCDFIARRIRGVLNSETDGPAVAAFFASHYSHWDYASGKWARGQTVVTTRDMLRALDLAAGGMDFRRAVDLTCKAQGEAIADALAIATVARA